MNRKLYVQTQLMMMTIQELRRTLLLGMLMLGGELMMPFFVLSSFNVCVKFLPVQLGCLANQI